MDHTDPIEEYCVEHQAELVADAEAEEKEDGELETFDESSIVDARTDCVYCGSRKDTNDDICPWCENTGHIKTTMEL
jgi:hypothetical protein